MQQKYIVAKGIREALEALNGGGARVIAGGTDLVIDLEEGAKDCETLVDVASIPELTRIWREGDELCVGACCTFAQLESDPLVLDGAKALADAASWVGSPQIRNVATIGGNVANAMPAADGAVALFGLGATLEIVDLNRRRRMLPIGECYSGIGKSAIDSAAELIVSIRFPFHGEARQCSYRRFALRQSLALPVAAATLGLEVRKGVVRDARIVLAPAGIMPWRAIEAERALLDMPFSKETLERACEDAAKAAPFRDSPARCSAAYKRLLARSLLFDAAEELCVNFERGGE